MGEEGGEGKIIVDRFNVSTTARTPGYSRWKKGENYHESIKSMQRVPSGKAGNGDGMRARQSPAEMMDGILYLAIFIFL